MEQRPSHRRGLARGSARGGAAGGLLLTGTNSESFPGETPPPETAVRAVDEPACLSPHLRRPTPSSSSSAPLRETHTDTHTRRQRRCCCQTSRIASRSRSPAPTVNKSDQRRAAPAAGVSTMVLLAARSRRCLHSCCMGTICLQLLLWILCAVNGEEQPFSVEVGTAVC